MIFNLIITCLISFLGAWLTHVVSVRYNQGPVKASSLLSVIAGLCFLVLGKVFPLLQTVPAIFMGATFVGMSGKPIFSNSMAVGIAGVTFGVLFEYNNHLFTGYGGGLGTLAFFSVIMTLGIFRVLAFCKEKIT